jgi:hypothetical protein
MCDGVTQKPTTVDWGKTKEEVVVNANGLE